MQGHETADTRVPFVGRDAELQEFAMLLERHASPIVLRGTGGVGKTRLALEAALRWETRSAANARFVELAGVVPDAVAAKVGRALGAREHPRGTALDALGTLRLDEPCLLVLDNCEDAAAAVTAVIDRLRAYDELCVVVTTRKALRIHGGAIIDVQPFGEADGIAFFQARAALARRQLDGGSDRAAARRIVKALDGLAVTLDLAAARLATLSTAELADELSEPTPYHFRSAASREVRHRTLNRVVDWTLGKLSVAAQRAFVIAGRYVNAFEPADIAALAERWDVDVPALVEELAEQSLLAPASDGGYTMLAPIRAVARRRLSRLADRRSIDDRFAQHMARVAAGLEDRLRSARAVEAIDALVRRYDDFASVLEWALAEPEMRLGKVVGIFVALAWLWTDGGRLGEGQRWCLRFAEHAEVLEPRQRGRIQYVALRVAQRACDYERMAELGPMLVSTFTQAGDRLGLARGYNGMGVAALYLGQFSQARTYVDTALALYRSLHHEVGIASALMNQGSIAFESGDPVTARERYLEALAIARPDGWDATLALAYGNLAEVAYAVHDADAVERNAREALAHLERIGDIARTAWVTNALARASIARYDVSADQRDRAEAGRRLIAAFALLEQERDDAYLAQCLETAACLLNAWQRYESAATLSLAAQRLRRERRTPAFGPTLAEAHAMLSRALQELGAEERARAAAAARVMPLDRLAANAVAILEQAGITAEA